MNPEINDGVARHIWQNSQVLCLIVGYDNIIRQTNSFVKLQTGMVLEGKPLSELFIQFDVPISITDYVKSGSSKTLVNVSSTIGFPSSFYFSFYDLGTSVLAIGEANCAEERAIEGSLLELTNELNALMCELQKRNADLKKLNDHKNQLLGIAAHDLRNPIGLILTYSDFLKNQLADKVNPSQNKMISTIESTSEFMLHLLDELLDITAIESGKLELELASTDLIEQIRLNIELNAVLAEKKNITINYEYEPNIPLMQVDAGKIEQVLNNLISNAIKYSYSFTHILVSVRIEYGVVKVSVSDEGQGIPKAELDIVFRPFGRTSVKSTAMERSTGLGLAIASNIIKGHRGNIGVESEVGKGSTFWFTLPINKEDK